MINWKRPLTEKEIEFKAMLMQSLPPVIARKEVDKLTGGWLSAKTLRNDDSKLAGPIKRYESGRKIIYKRDDLIEYGIRRFGLIEKEVLL